MNTENKDQKAEEKKEEKKLSNLNYMIVEIKLPKPTHLTIGTSESETQEETHEIKNKEEKEEKEKPSDEEYDEDDDEDEDDKDTSPLDIEIKTVLAAIITNEFYNFLARIVKSGVDVSLLGENTNIPHILESIKYYREKFDFPVGMNDKNKKILLSLIPILWDDYTYTIEEIADLTGISSDEIVELIAKYRDKE